MLRNLLTKNKTNKIVSAIRSFRMLVSSRRSHLDIARRILKCSNNRLRAGIQLWKKHSSIEKIQEETSKSTQQKGA